MKIPRAVTAAVIAAALVAVLALVFPWPRGFAGHPSGDAKLAREVADHVAGGYRHAGAFARFGPGIDPVFAGYGADEHTTFEIGSLTKTFTAALFADALKRREVRAGDTLGDIFAELRGSATGSLTLEQLAEQQTGFPQAADRVRPQHLLLAALRLDPYVDELPQVLAHAADTQPDPGHYAYSNLGVALLGQALAKKAGTSYPQLVQQRLLDPLQMTETSVPERHSDLPAGSPHGYTASGLPAGAWTLGALAPAGSIRSTAHDMAIWMSATAAGTAPGADAVKARASAGGSPGHESRIGYTWMHTDGVTWHNGGTGGYRSWAGFDDAGRGLVVLSDTSVSVDGAMKLVGPEQPDAAEQADEAKQPDAASATGDAAEGER